MTWQQMTPGPPSRGMSHPRQRRGTGAAKGTRCPGHPNTCQEHKHSSDHVRATFCVWPRWLDRLLTTFPSGSSSTSQGPGLSVWIVAGPLLSLALAFAQLPGLRLRPNCS